MNIVNSYAGEEPFLLSGFFKTDYPKQLFPDITVLVLNYSLFIVAVSRDRYNPLFFRIDANAVK